MHIILFQLAPSRGGANNLSNHWQERENTLCGVPIEGCAFQSSFLFVQWGVTLIGPPSKKILKTLTLPPKYKFALPKYKLYCHFYFKTLWSVSLWPTYYAYESSTLGKAYGIKCYWEHNEQHIWNLGTCCECIKHTWIEHIGNITIWKIPTPPTLFPKGKKLGSFGVDVASPHWLSQIIFLSVFHHPSLP
jgi:hypothetical protein